MAKRHVVDYFNKVANQYKDMLDELKDFEKECNSGLVEPEKFEQFKQILQPIKNNYMMWSYAMYLLNLPNNEKKVKTVKRRGKMHVKDVGGFGENNEYIKNLRKQKDKNRP